MNSKSIPVIITLLAAAITCLASVLQGVSFDIFTKRLLGAVICFAIIGIIVRVILDRSFRIMEPEDKETEEKQDEEELEDIHSEEKQEE